jgi:hypothetical protein
MILELNNGGQIVLNDCHWTPGLYLAAGNMRGSQGVIIAPAEIDQVIAELTRVRASIAEREQQQRSAA